MIILQMISWLIHDAGCEEIDNVLDMSIEFADSIPIEF